MEINRRSLLQWASTGIALQAMPRRAFARDFPSAPITLVTPFPAGGPSDTIARLLAEHMRFDLGQRVVVENVSGANGGIGVGRVVRANPDGYTIGIGQTGTHVLNGAMYDLPYDLVADLRPVAMLTDSPIMLVGKQGLPADDVAGLISWLKAYPGKASAGIPGVGSLAHVCFSLFQNVTKTDFALVPYRGVAPAVQDLSSGTLDLMITDLISTLPLVQSKSIRAFAVTSRERMDLAPELPTIREVGFPELEVSIWHGIWAPKTTPAEVVTRLNRSISTALDDVNIRGRLATLGQIVVPPQQRSPESLMAHQKAEIERWWPIIRAANIRASSN